MLSIQQRRGFYETGAAADQEEQNRGGNREPGESQLPQEVRQIDRDQARLRLLPQRRHSLEGSGPGESDPEAGPNVLVDTDHDCPHPAETG